MENDTRRLGTHVPVAPGYAAVLGDVVGSRGAGPEVFDRLRDVLAQADRIVPGFQPLQITVGDEFQGLYPRLGTALNASLLVRLLLHDVTEVRVGVGWGVLTRWDPDRAPYEQDGPAWWAARAALEVVDRQERGSGMPAGWRTAVRFADPAASGADETIASGAPEAPDARAAGDDGPPADEQPAATIGPAPPRHLDVQVMGALEGLLMLRDQVLHGMDGRDVELVVALLDGASVTDAAEQVGISQQAASRRLRSNGGYALVRSWHLLDGGND